MKHPITIRLPEELYNKIKADAVFAQRSINKQIVYMLWGIYYIYTVSSTVTTNTTPEVKHEPESTSHNPDV
jgi:uncharacterized membrane protein YuzA (DUF378 family)